MEGKQKDVERALVQAALPGCYAGTEPLHATFDLNPS